MNNCKKKASRRFKATANSVTYHVIELEPEELASYVRRAEEYILPLVQELSLDAGCTQFLLAQYTRALITRNALFDIESAMAMANMVLTLWQIGHYTPISKYPYALEETLLCIYGGSDANTNEGSQSRPVADEKADFPCESNRAPETGKEKVG